MSDLAWMRRRFYEDLQGHQRPPQPIAVSRDLYDAYMVRWEALTPVNRFVGPNGEYLLYCCPLVLREDWDGPRMEWA